MVTFNHSNIFIRSNTISSKNNLNFYPTSPKKPAKPWRMPNSSFGMKNWMWIQAIREMMWLWNCPIPSVSQEPFHIPIYWSNPSDADYYFVGIHVRHGLDITMHSRNLRHGHTFASIDYYQKAIQYFIKEFNWRKIIFVVAGDDITWAKKVFAQFPKGSGFTLLIVEHVLFFRKISLRRKWPTRNWHGNFETMQRNDYVDGHLLLVDCLPHQWSRGVLLRMAPKELRIGFTRK